MDRDLEQALEASRVEAWQLERDRELQAAIKLSEVDDASTASGGSRTPSPEPENGDGRNLRKAIRLSMVDDATRSPSPEPEDEDSRNLRKAIRLSMMDDASTASGSSSQEPFKETKGTKRKPEEDLSQIRKRAYVASQTSLESNPLNSDSGSTYMTPAASEQIVSSLCSPSTLEAKITYPNGALRITRTPGRSKAKNCINLKDVIQGKSLVSACAFSFYIGEEELYSHFPLSRESDTVPIYIGRDINMDPMAPEACRQTGVVLFGEDGKPGKIAKKHMEVVVPKLCDMYTRQQGINYHAFYAWCSGSSHSKILVLVYPTFLRVVFTSCNLMDIDTVLGDNHWYVHDLPKISSPPTSTQPSFETDFLAHLSALGTPESFLTSIRGNYDYSAVKVHLVTSIPKVCAGVKAEDHGLLRLRRIVRELNPHLASMGPTQLRLEVCTASVGGLTAKWLNGFRDCALGQGSITAVDDNRPVPPLKLFYPTVNDVRNADQRSQEAASNIGCHLRPWVDVPTAITRIFHHYQSKDQGKLFHQKFILAYDPSDTNAAPYYVYVGSANFSQSAWGTLEVDKAKQANVATCGTKLTKVTNFECGVVVPGDLIHTLMETGTASWQDGIVPHDQNAAPYTLPRDKPWNDPRWVVG